MGSAHLEVVHRIAEPRCSRIVCRPSKLALQALGAAVMAQTSNPRVAIVCSNRMSDYWASGRRQRQVTAGVHRKVAVDASGLCLTMLGETGLTMAAATEEAAAGSCNVERGAPGVGARVLGDLHHDLRGLGDHQGAEAQGVRRDGRDQRACHWQQSAAVSTLELRSMSCNDVHIRQVD
jgi:hypothetical protein